MICEVCGRSEPAPVAEPWHFRMNGFVAEGLREHGLLPVIWCLGKCAAKARSSFFYLQPHELFFSEESVNNEKSDAELDLLVVSDGLVRLIEAKASRQGIDINKTAELAMRLRPDVVTLAVMEATSSALAARLSELRQRLAGSNIEADLMTLLPGDIEDSPTLPDGSSYRVSISF